MTPLRLPFRERYGGVRYYVPTFLSTSHTVAL
jgi:hypothetical protein